CSTCRRVRIAPTTSISPTERATTSTVATNRLVRSDHRRFTLSAPRRRDGCCVASWNYRPRRTCRLGLSSGIASAASVLGPDGLVPRAADGPDQLRLAELPAELRDVHVDRARPARVGHPPDAIEELIAADDDPGVLDQHREQVELLRCQLDSASVDGDL